MTALTASTALNQLESLLADTHLQEPRPIADMGLTEAQKQHIAKRFDLSDKAMRAAAVLVPIQPTKQGVEIILTQRSEHLKHHPGQISFPGGSQEPHDADLAQTALRESDEEISLTPERVRVLGYLPDYPTITGFRVTPIVGLVDASATVQADNQEVAAIHRIPFDLLLGDEGFVERTIEHEGMKLPFFEIFHGDLRIWGATAGMLFLLRKIIRSAD